MVISSTINIISNATPIYNRPRVHCSLPLIIISVCQHDPTRLISVYNFCKYDKATGGGAGSLLIFSRSYRIAYGENQLAKKPQQEILCLAKVMIY